MNPIIAVRLQKLKNQNLSILKLINSSRDRLSILNIHDNSAFLPRKVYPLE